MKIYKSSIISCDKNNTVSRFMGVEKGRITFVGNKLPDNQKNNVVDLGDKAIVPAFGDGHIHFSNWALLAVSQFDVREATDIADLQKMVLNFVQNRVKNKGKHKIIISFGHSPHSIKEKRLVTREELDAVCPDIPLIIVCYDGHSAIFNSKLGSLFPAEMETLRGFDREKGQLINEAYFKGTDFASSLVPTLTLLSSIAGGYDLLAEKGIGRIHAVEGIGFPGDLDVDVVRLAAKAAARKNGFQSRIFFQTMDTNKVTKRKLPRIGGCFATALDGCFAVKDAALHEPYTDEPDSRGILFQSEEQVFTFVKEAHSKGLQIQMHTIGDAAVTRAVDAIESALKDNPCKDHRHTLIHACLIRPEDRKRIADLGIRITLQPAFLISPLEPLEFLEKILGDRARTGSPLKTMRNEGIPVSGGSDAPVTFPDPIEGIYAACNHPYHDNESLSIQEALKMFTIDLAEDCFDEKKRGTLEVGKVADFVILNKNPLSMKPENLRELRTEQLYLSGSKYKKGMGLTEMILRGLFGPKTII